MPGKKTLLLRNRRTVFKELDEVELKRFFRTKRASAQAEIIVNHRSTNSAFRFSRVFKHVPRGFGQIDEIIELAGAAQPQTAVDYHAFAIYVCSLFAEQIRRDIGQLFMTAKAFHWMIISGALFEIFGR